MKKIIFLYIFFIHNLFSMEINEYLSDVYFANGINTDEKIAKKSRDLLSRKFKLYNPIAYKKIKEWKVSFNHTNGIGVDLYESLLQKIYEDEPGKSFAPFIWNMDEISDYFVFSFKKIVKKIAKKTPKPFIKAYSVKVAKKLAKKVAKVYNSIHGNKYTEEQLEAMFNDVFDYLIEQGTEKYLDMTEEDIIKQEQLDVQIQKINYIKSIIEGHGVIIVAHSQGNLFTNRVYVDLEFNNPINGYAWIRQYISAIGVASPANNILGKKEPYITFDNDMIQLVLDSLPVNVANPRRYHIKNNLNEDLGETLYSVRAHSFMTSYMATDITRNRILSFIDSKAKEHYKRPSQWEVEQELNKNSCDYRVTVKHRSDLRIEIGEAVYPFNLTKKVYYVDNEYVMGSYGGNKIFNDWQGKKSNECSMLNNEEHEVITNGEPSDGGDDSNDDNTDDNNTGGDTDSGDGADNGDDTTDPTQDPNKVCVSNFFKYYGDGTIQDDLKKGDKDAELYDDGTKHQVKELQEFLEAFGYNVGSSGADGWFGTDTKNALIDFQSANGLDADGIVGPNTRDAMNAQNCYDK